VSPAGLTYPEVGATAGALPEGYHHVRAERVVGEGRELFERCCEVVLTWGVQRGAGLVVEHPGRVRVGQDQRVGLPLGPLRLWAPCRVVYVVEERDRCGFAYGTLPGHPETGEESFVVSLEPSGEVRFEIRAFSRPARWFSRLGAPVTARVQARVTRRYLDAVA
jgi:uncharacterized protein (UPF0548 family)